MQDLVAETAAWREKAKAAGPGWRVWRYEEANGLLIVWRFRLLAPGDEPDGLGTIVGP